MNTRVKFGSALLLQVGQFSVGVNSIEPRNAPSHNIRVQHTASTEARGCEVALKFLTAIGLAVLLATPVHSQARLGQRDKFGPGDTKGSRNAQQQSEGRLSFAAFKFAVIRPIDACRKCERVLSKALLNAKRSGNLTECASDRGLERSRTSC